MDGMIAGILFPKLLLEPKDPADGGNHNHKAFSVIAFDRTV